MRTLSTCLLLLVLAAFLLAGCDNTTDPAEAERLARFAVELPFEVVADEPFNLVVTAVGDGGSEPLAGADMTVTLSVSSGEIVPAQVDLTAGVGSVVATIGGAPVGRVTITAQSGGVSGSAEIPSLLLRELPGDGADGAAGAIPDLPLRPRAEDYADGHPDLGDVGASTSLLWLAFQPEVSVDEANVVIAGSGGLIAGGAPGVVILRLPTSGHAELAAALAALQDDARVARAAPDVLVGALVVSRPNGGSPADWTWDLTPGGGNWGLERIRVPQMWNLNGNPRRLGSSTVTGIVDVGFASSHPDLVLATLGDTRTGDHGTHVAGTIGATFDNGIGIDGVNPFASLVVHAPSFASILPGGLSRHSWGEAMTDGLDALLNRSSSRVINMSLGYNWYKADIDPSQSIAAQTLADAQGWMLAQSLALRSLVQDLPLIVVAAGNESGRGAGVQNARWSSPMTNAALAHGAGDILVVENVMDAPAANLGEVERSPTSCIAGQVSAPGHGVRSTISGGDYGSMTGTSMAAPHVAGLAGYLLALDPELDNAQLRDLLLTVAVPADGVAQPRIDAFAAAMDIDRVRGNDAVLRMLVDIDDGSMDGNLRISYESGAVVTDEDLDRNGGEGDGAVDMSDFRRWRDWLLQIEGTGQLDGPDDHPKMDLNRDGVVTDAATENVFPRGDFNGDGIIDREARSFVPGAIQAEVTDLEVLQWVFADDHYEADQLPELLASGDIAVAVADLLLDTDGADHVVVRVENAATDALIASRTLDFEQPLTVVTVPAPAPLPDGYRLRAIVHDSDGAELGQARQEIGLHLGEDRYWSPQLSPQLVVEITAPDQAEPETPYPLLVRAGVRPVDEDEGIEYQAGIAIALQVSAGSLASDGGVTDVDGYFETEASLEATTESMVIFATASLEGHDDVTEQVTVSRLIPTGTITPFLRVEPPSLRTLVTLRVSASGDDPDDPDQWQDMFLLDPADLDLFTGSMAHSSSGVFDDLSYSASGSVGFLREILRDPATQEVTAFRVTVTAHGEASATDANPTGALARVRALLPFDFYIADAPVTIRITGTSNYLRDDSWGDAYLAVRKDVMDHTGNIANYVLDEGFSEIDEALTLDPGHIYRIMCELTPGVYDGSFDLDVDWTITHEE